jgi:release factor glutamine methyltransferase
MADDQIRVWTIRELMKSAIDYLSKKEIDNARLTVELLLSHALDLQRIQLYTNFDKPLTHDEVRCFRQLYERRLSGEPVQYIIGSTSFMGLQFKVDRRVFIPRPETESLLEQIIVFDQDYGNEKDLEVFEVGTGSGNIAISIAKFIKHARVTAIDISAYALEVARQNAQLHSVESRVEFSQMDLFDLADDILQARYDLLVSNPPYVAKDEWEQLQKEIRDFEPQSAVTDGNDGFLFHRRIIEIIPGILKIGGGVLLEVGFGQAERVAQELEAANVRQVRITADLQGIPRVVSGVWLGSQPSFFCLN